MSALDDLGRMFDRREADAIIAYVAEMAGSGEGGSLATFDERDLSGIDNVVFQDDALAISSGFLRSSVVDTTDANFKRIMVEVKMVLTGAESPVLTEIDIRLDNLLEYVEALGADTYDVPVGVKALWAGEIAGRAAGGMLVLPGSPDDTVRAQLCDASGTPLIVAVETNDFVAFNASWLIEED